MDGVIGRNGFAEPGAKREGDGKTPSGVYPIGPAFGYAPSANTKLDYRQATANDFWVDDPESADYNRWVVGKPQAKSFELMKRDDELYKLGAVIQYNTEPVVPGRGSAIFLHVWRGPDSTTAGCVALSESDVASLLKWLDKTKHPVVVLNPR
jgi:L,D-peptidoglycan transpeptidase YkuD (ErfK/YbiS/YcfS/YnhG family)